MAEEGSTTHWSRAVSTLSEDQGTVELSRALRAA